MISRHSFISLAFIFSLAAVSCAKNKKSDPVKPIDSSGLFHTARMGGMRLWHGSHYYYAYGIHFPITINESYALPDTSFSVTVVNDSVVQLGGETFRYDQTDTPGHIYFFGMAYYFYRYHSGKGIAYFYDKDSIVFCQGDIHGTSDFWQLSDVYHTD